MNFLLISRYFLGHFHTEHFQLLSGIKFTLRPRLYGKIYFSIIFLTTAIAFVTTNIKKITERYKEWKFHRHIIVNLIEQPCEGQLQFNNVKNNFPLLSGFQITLLVGFVLAGNITFWFLNYTFKDSMYFYKQFLFKQFTLAFIFNIVVPLIYLIKKKMMRKYLWKYITDFKF